MATAAMISEPTKAPIGVESLQRFLIYNVPWDEYATLVKLWDGRHFRMTYDKGNPGAREQTSQA